MKQLLAYENDFTTKESFLIKSKRNAENGEYNYEDLPEKIQVDLWLKETCTVLFKHLRKDEITKLFLGILEAIPEGMSKSDSTQILIELLYYGLTEIIPKDFQNKEEVTQIISLIERKLSNKSINHIEWQTAINNISRIARKTRYTIHYAVLYTAYTVFSTTSDFTSFYHVSDFDKNIADSCKASIGHLVLLTLDSSLNIQIGEKLIELLTNVESPNKIT